MGIYNKLDYELPKELEDYIESESIEFAVKSKRYQPITKALPILIFGVFWNLIVGCIGIAVLFVYFNSRKINNNTFKDMNDYVKTGFRIEEETVFLIFLSVFVIAGIYLIINGLYILLKPGRLFVGTPNRLIVYKKGEIRTIKWGQFTGEITVKGSVNIGSVYLTMRTGEFISNDETKSFEPEKIYMVGIPNPYEIEKIYRKRITESDLTQKNSIKFIS